MDPKAKINATSTDSSKIGGSYGAGSLTVGSNVSAAVSSSAPAGNNPRIDLLHNTGGNTFQNTSTIPVTQPSMAAAASPSPVPAPLPKPAPTPVPMPARKSHKKAVVVTMFFLLLLAGVGAGLWWWMQPKDEPVTSTPPPVALKAAAPVKLNIVEDDGTTEIPVGGTTKSTNLFFIATLETEANSGSAKPEIEVQPIGTAFTGTPTHSGADVIANGKNLSFRVPVEGLKPGAYHWQVRTSVAGEQSEWTIAGDGQKADFTVEQAEVAQVTPPPPAATPPPIVTPPPPPPVTPPVEQPTTLARTGEGTTLVNTAAIILLVISGISIVAARRYGWR